MKIIKYVSFTFILFPLTTILIGCSPESKFLDKPDDTNLELWITENVTDTDLLHMTYLPGYFGASEYLDSRYSPIKREDGNDVAPDVHVTYLLTSYPDYSSGGSYVTSIDISDPQIYVYGLSMNSTDSQISNTMSELGFKKRNNYNSWYKNNCFFTFNSFNIHISSAITNNDNIVF